MAQFSPARTHWLAATAISEGVPLDTTQQQLDLANSLDEQAVVLEGEAAELDATDRVAAMGKRYAAQEIRRKSAILRGAPPK